MGDQMQQVHGHTLLEYDHPSVAYQDTTQGGERRRSSYEFEIVADLVRSRRDMAQKAIVLAQSQRILGELGTIRLS